MTASASALAEFRRWRPLLDELAGGVHPWRWRAAGVGPEAAARLAADSRSRRLLSLRLDWLGRPAGGAESDQSGAWPDWSEWRRAGGAALAPGAELERCGLRLGAGLFRSRVAKLVLGREVGALKAAVGADAYFFALRQAMLVKELDSLSRDSVGGGELAGQIRRAGDLGLSVWLASLPDGLADRVILKLPPEIDAAGYGIRGWPERDRERWLAALTRIFVLTFGKI